MSCLSNVGHWSPCGRVTLPSSSIAPLPRLALLTFASSKCLGPHPLYSLGFHCSQHGPTTRSSVESNANKASLLSDHGYLAHKKTHPFRTLPYFMPGAGILRSWAVSYGQGTPVLSTILYPFGYKAAFVNFLVQAFW